MGIKFRCQGCDKKLHVKAYLAGKRGVCPYCGAKVRIPRTREAAGDEPRENATAGEASDSGRQSVSSSARKHAPAATAVAASQDAPPGPGGDAIEEAPEAVWYVRPPSGGQYGPADGAIMRRWLEEGRVSGDSLVWREGWNDWKAADSVFRELQGAAAPVVSAETTPSQNVAADAFAFGEGRTALRQPHGRAPQKSTARNVAIVVTLTIVCTALLIALFLVLWGGS